MRRTARNESAARAAATARGLGGRLGGRLDGRSAARSAGPATVGKGPAPTLSARSVVLSYGRTPALRGVTLEVAPGEILAVTGPSGSGKSTLMLCLAGVVVPDAGSVTYRDRRISSEGEAARSRLRRERFGVLFQFGQLVPELTAVENVALPLLLSGRRRREAVTAATSWLARFGVADLADIRPSQMSGGQAQRVAVARAMVTEPEVLFADEPTGALDTVSGEQVMGQLVRVAREAATTVLLVTHDTRIAAYGDREVHLRDGLLDGDEALVLDTDRSPGWGGPAGLRGRGRPSPSSPSPSSPSGPGSRRAGR